MKLGVYKGKDTNVLFFVTGKSKRNKIKGFTYYKNGPFKNKKTFFAVSQTEEQFFKGLKFLGEFSDFPEIDLKDK